MTGSSFSTNFDERRQLEALDRPALERYQLERLNTLLAVMLPHNDFYRRKLGTDSLRLDRLDQLAEIPTTTKHELATGPDYPRVANLTWPVDRYVRFHQTSGTQGRPLIVHDTASDWSWWQNAWQYVLDAAEVTSDDRALLAFSFGPFVGFWSAHDALAARNTMVIPGGGMSSLARLALLETSAATLLFSTPSYALRLIETAAEENVDLGRLAVKRLVVAGEPGGSIPAIRERIEAAWGAQVIDHSGATEVGPWGYGDAGGRGLWVMESEFIAEFIALETGRPAREGELAELVLTNLGRVGCPVLRYRTGDLVRPSWNSPGPRKFAFLHGGVLGRADDMLIVRGVNIFPGSIEQILRGFPEVAEYRVTVCRAGSLDQLEIEVEDQADEPGRIAKQLEIRLGLKALVRVVPAGSLPRFDAKGRRFLDQRG